MTVSFHLKNGFICKYNPKTNLEHNISAHNNNKTVYRMYQQTKIEFQEWSKHHNDINHFVLTHSDLHRINTTTLYNIRTKINEKLNDVQYISNELSQYKEFSSVIHTDQDNKLLSCVVLNRILINTHYCDILTVDDTVGIDTFDYPLINVVCKDADDHL